MRSLEFLVKIHITVLCAFQSLYKEALRDAVERTWARFAAVFPVGVVVTAQTRGSFSPWNLKCFPPLTFEQNIQWTSRGLRYCWRKKQYNSYLCFCSTWVTLDLLKFLFILFFSSGLWAGNFPSPSPQPIKFLMTAKMRRLSLASYHLHSWSTPRSGTTGKLVRPSGKNHCVYYNGKVIGKVIAPRHKQIQAW